jgi:hypothetical protein
VIVSIVLVISLYLKLQTLKPILSVVHMFLSVVTYQCLISNNFYRYVKIIFNFKNLIYFALVSGYLNG